MANHANEKYLPRLKGLSLQASMQVEHVIKNSNEKLSKAKRSSSLVRQPCLSVVYANYQYANYQYSAEVHIQYGV